MKTNLRKPNIKRLKIHSTSNVCKKVYFGTKEVADAFILKRSKEGDARPATAYLCHRCNCWHLTSWETPDIDKLIKEIQNDIDMIQEEYERQYQEDINHIDYCLTKYQKMEIEVNNLRLENFKLKHEISKKHVL